MPVVFEDDLLFLAASRARCIRQFQHPAELWKTGMPVIGHKTAVSKIYLIAITTNPGRQKRVRSSLLILPNTIERILGNVSADPPVVCGHTWGPVPGPCSALDTAKSNHICLFQQCHSEHNMDLI